MRLYKPLDSAMGLCSASCRVAPASGSASEPAKAAPPKSSHLPAAEQDLPLLRAAGLPPADVQDPPLLLAHGVAPADVQDPPLLHAHGLPPGEVQGASRHAEAAEGPDAEPAEQGSDAARDASELPVEVTNETPSAQRIELYRSRACLFVTTRILVVDLLSARVHGNQARSCFRAVHNMCRIDIAHRHEFRKHALCVVAALHAQMSHWG